MRNHPGSHYAIHRQPRRIGMRIEKLLPLTVAMLHGFKPDRCRRLMNGVKNKKGLTMIEVLMAMTIFAIGFLALGTMVISTTRNNTTGNIVTHATMLARERIEYLKSLPIEQIKIQCSDDRVPERVADIFELVCGVEASFSDSANIIEVKVSWRRHGKNREVVLKTLTRGNGT